MVTEINKQQLQAKYKQLNPNGHFFDPDTMRFFDSKVMPYCIQFRETYYFITQEKKGFSSSEHAMTVRAMEPNGDIVKISNFYEFESLYKAISFLNDFINGLKWNQVPL